MKFCISIFFLLIINFNSFSQSILTGTILDSSTNMPIEGVNVYLSNTSLGTITNKNGQFEIKNIPQGKFELICSSLNFNVKIVNIYSNNIPVNLNISLIPTFHILNDVIVESYDDDGWENWGQYFKINFIGTSIYASNCKLINPDDLHFKYNNKTNILKAFSHEKLIFENRSLGYKIYYLLVKFEYDLENNKFKYIGYPLFEELSPKNNAERLLWKNNREIVYQGSLMHFMRSLFDNKLYEEGFEVKTLKKIYLNERKRVKMMYNRLQENDKKNMDKDTLEYYSKVSSLSVSIDTIILNKLLKRQDIVFDIDQSIEKGAVLFEFDDFLHITNVKKKEPIDYSQFLLKRPNRDYVFSDITLPSRTGITVFKNGSYFYGENLFTNGYWAWFEKISTLLPFDYYPN